MSKKNSESFQFMVLFFFFMLCGILEVVKKQQSMSGLFFLAHPVLYSTVVANKGSTAGNPKKTASNKA